MSTPLAVSLKLIGTKFIAFYSVGLVVDIKSAVRADIFEDDRAATIYCKREHTTAEA